MLRDRKNTVSIQILLNFICVSNEISLNNLTKLIYRCFSFLPIALINYPDQSNLGTKGFILTHNSRGRSLPCQTKTWHGGWGAGCGDGGRHRKLAGHFSSSVWEQKEQTGAPSSDLLPPTRSSPQCQHFRNKKSAST